MFVLLIGIAVWLPGLRLRRVAAQGLHYRARTALPWPGADLPGALMRVMTFDGAGNITGSTIQVSPDPSSDVLVKTNKGTGTATFPNNNGRPPSTVAFVITYGGSSLMLLGTSGFGNLVLSGTARKR